MRPDAAAAGPGPGLRDPRLAGLTAALLIHLALLGPVLWGLRGGGTFEVEADPDVIPLDLAPPAWPGVPIRRAAASLPSDPSPRTPKLTEAGRSAPPAAPGVTGPPVTAPAPPDSALIDEGQRIGGEAAVRQSWGGDVCRDVSNFKAWEAANCRERGPALRAEARGSPPAEIARPEPRRGRPPGEARDEAFAEQAAANEAWRSYTRERDAPYPGLRSLLKHH